MCLLKSTPSKSHSWSRTWVTVDTIYRTKRREAWSNRRLTRGKRHGHLQPRVWTSPFRSSYRSVSEIWIKKRSDGLWIIPSLESTSSCPSSGNSHANRLEVQNRPVISIWKRSSDSKKHPMSRSSRSSHLIRLWPFRKTRTRAKRRQKRN